MFASCVYGMLTYTFWSFFRYEVQCLSRTMTKSSHAAHPHNEASSDDGAVGRMPDFIIIGAMKCATSTLHAQLALQSGVMMSQPKEPCFFSDDDKYALGVGWYKSLYGSAEPNDLCGEASTHYTTLPTYPPTADRLHRHVPKAKLVYTMPHPVERLLPPYVPAWTERTIVAPIHVCSARDPPLLGYGR